MRPGARLPRRGAWAAVAALLLVLVAPMGTALGQGHATATGVRTQVPGDAVVATATLTSVDPAAATSDDVLELRGVLRNVGERTLTDPVAAFRWSSDPVQTLDELALVQDNPLFRYGRVEYGYSQPLDTLQPGDEVEFVVEVPLAELPVGSGVHVMGVDVLATLPDGLRVFVASARTTVPIDIDADPLPVALLWPLVTAPSLLPDGRLLDDSLADEVARGGRLETLARVAAGSEVTWVLDPDLVDTLDAMVGGYSTERPPEEGVGAADAAEFLARLPTAISAESDVRQIPAADPDVGGALAAGLTPSEVEQWVSDGVVDTSVEDLLARPVPRVTLLTDRRVTSEMLDAYVSAGADTAVLDRDAVSPTPSSPRVEVEGIQRADIPALLAEPLPSGNDDSDADASPEVTVHQALLSSTALLAESANAPDALVLAPPTRWAPDEQLASTVLEGWQSAPWVDPVPVRDIPPAPDSVSLAPTGEPAPVDPGIVDELSALQDDLARLEPLFTEPPVAPGELPRAGARSTSYAWQEAPERGLAYVETLGATVSNVEDQVQIVLSPSVTLSSRSGRFPITLVNDSAADVQVGVSFTSQNTSRLRVEDIDPVVLTAGEKRTFTATALATANGRVQVAAEAVTTDGDLVGDPASTIVDVTNVGALGWTVVAVGGILFGAAALRSRLRRRTSQADPA